VSGPGAPLPLEAAGLIEGCYLAKAHAWLDRGTGGFPHVTEAGRWSASVDGHWSGGFWAGQLWLLWHATGDARLRAGLDGCLARLAARKDAASVDFDLGFLYLYGFALGHRLTGEPRLRSQALAAADRLLGLVHGRSRLIVHRYPGRRDDAVSTIIDVLMNLGLLWWAERETGLGLYGAAAARHARKSLRWLQRADGSVAQLADLDRDSGELIALGTLNGLAADSTWSRGQAWAVYGFLLATLATRQQAFHRAFVRALRFFLERLPEDGLPPWDFDAPAESRAVKDSSASAIVLAALVRARAQGCLPSWAGDFEGRLRAGLAGALASEADDGVLAAGCHRYRLGSGVGGASVWGDYYLLEALTGLAPL